MKIEILDEAEADLIEGYHHVDSEPLRKTVNVSSLVAVIVLLAECHFLFD